MYKCQIYSSSYLRYSPLNLSAHIIDTLFTHDMTSLLFSTFAIRINLDILWIYVEQASLWYFYLVFILTIKEVTAHQSSKSPVFLPTLYKYIYMCVCVCVCVCVCNNQSINGQCNTVLLLAFIAVKGLHKVSWRTHISLDFSTAFNVF